VRRARDVAVSVVGDDPALEHHPVLADEIRTMVDEDEAAFLFKS
jgi:hypothetical protein